MGPFLGHFKQVHGLTAFGNTGGTDFNSYRLTLFNVYSHDPLRLLKEGSETLDVDWTVELKHQIGLSPKT